MTWSELEKIRALALGGSAEQIQQHAPHLLLRLAHEVNCLSRQLAHAQAALREALSAEPAETRAERLVREMRVIHERYARKER